MRDPEQIRRDSIVIPLILIKTAPINIACKILSAVLINIIGNRGDRIPSYLLRILNSTRRFCARPSAVLLGAMGCENAYPWDSSLPAPIPLSAR